MYFLKWVMLLTAWPIFRFLWEIDSIGCENLCKSEKKFIFESCMTKL